DDVKDCRLLVPGLPPIDAAPLPAGRGDAARHFSSNFCTGEWSLLLPKLVPDRNRERYVSLPKEKSAPPHRYPGRRPDRPARYTQSVRSYLHIGPPVPLPAVHP